MPQNNLTINYLFLFFLILGISKPVLSQDLSYPVVDTRVSDYSNNEQLISEPRQGDAFFGQDANYEGFQPSYTDHKDGTITDNISGLTWEQDMGSKITYSDAFIKADTMALGGFEDWRVPTIKELYSLILFSGRVSGATAIKMFIDTDYFIQPLGDPGLGEREIDAQTWSSTQYTGLTMNGDSTLFGVNFVDGRIKGYPKYQPGTQNTVPRTMYFRMVRGNPAYGLNEFSRDNDAVITDRATGLMWQRTDDGVMRDWEEALAYAESLELGGYDDWRLPNAKELQSIVDYTRSPQATGSPAIDPLFICTEISDPKGKSGQYPYFWTATTHQDGPEPYSSAIYIAFGEAQGEMNGNLMDVHGAGSQRSDPKSGDPDAYPQFFGPQGDVRYVYNAVRCVRDITPLSANEEVPAQQLAYIYPNPVSRTCILESGRKGITYDLKLFDAMGKVLLENKRLCEGNLVLDLSDLSIGIYFLSLSCSDAKTNIKLVKK